MTQTDMLREIREQPDALARTLAALLPTRSRIARLADGRRHVLFVARGSSDNAAIYGRYLCEVLAGRQAALAAPSIATHYRADVDLTDTVAVCVSQSGETAEIAETQAWAAAHGARTVAVTNVGDSTLARAADLALVTEAGAELAVPATKTYTAQLAAVAVLVSALGDGAGLDGAFGRVPAEASRLLDSAPSAEDAAALLAASADTLVTGRGITYGTALEVALKLEETCLRPVRGLSYADLRHGPMAVVDADVAAVLVAAPDGPTVDGMTQLATAVRGRHAAVVGIGGDAAFAGNCDIVLPGPDLPETLAPLALVIPGQLMVEALARRLGLDPDRPRGLSKVTQTEG
jgi:glutamine---fructose-6-phosphate transaminase (isomerizing)